MRVLVVDDESLIRMDMRSILESQGHTIVGEGRNGVEGLELTKEHKPDVVLMDVKMPILDGIEAARQIAFSKLAPVVLLTAYNQADLVQKASESGVYGYLLKPVKEEQVIPTLQIAVGRFQKDMQVVADMKSLETKLEERILISKATGLLMKKQNITEEEAFNRIRKFSMDKGYTVAKTCEAIIKIYNKQ